MSTLDPKTIAALRASSHVFLNPELSKERAVELLDELGFLGVVDLVGLLASVMTGSISAEHERFVVKIKRVRKKKPS